MATSSCTLGVDEGCDAGFIPEFVPDGDRSYAPAGCQAFSRFPWRALL